MIGAGQMGAGIAQVCAGAGLEVALLDVNRERAAQGKAGIEKQLARLVAKGKFSAETTSALLGRITPSDASAFATADIAIEAATEQRELKARLLRGCRPGAAPHALLLSNTSSISLTWLAAQTKRPEQVAGMHFMNPVPVMQLVELVRGLQTSDETLALVRGFAERLGKTVIVSHDRAGFIVNRMLVPLLNEACFALEEGLGTAPDIDAGARLGLNHPLGPLELARIWSGSIRCSRSARSCIVTSATTNTVLRARLRNLVAAGWLGKKTGRGFYRYDAQGGRLEPSVARWGTA